MKNTIKNTISTTIETYKKMLDNENFIDNIENIANTIINAYKNNNKVLIAGNGGSAADAQHIAGELVNRFYFDRPALSAIALTTDTSVLTCISNDSDYNEVFSRQIEANGREGDIFIGISTSGNSQNIIRAFHKCKEMNILTIALTGSAEGNMDKICDYIIKIPIDLTPRVQEGHLIVEHILCALIEEKLYKDV